MTPAQKKVLYVLIGLGALVLLALIPANAAGAKDANMLALFEVDEYAQYPHVLRMLTPGDTPYQTLRNFVIYLHYFYGYPFYLFSALALLPVKLGLGSGWQDATRVIVTVLREMVSVLPMLLSAGLLVWMQTRFKPGWLAVGLYILLLSVPGVVVNHLWWHPDSLSFLLVTLTLFFLDRDRLSFGRNFVLAGLICGAAVGMKFQGLFFVLAVPLLLIWGLAVRRIRAGRAVLLAGMFVGLMAAGLVLTNPLLLLPQERAEIIRTQQTLFREINTGQILINSASFFENGRFPADVRVHYGEPLFLLLALAGLTLGLSHPDRRRLNALILAWILPAGWAVLNAATRRTHYYFPILLPLISCLVNLAPAYLPPAVSAWGKSRPAKAILGLLTLGLLVQWGAFIRTDAGILRTQLARETSSAPIQFYQQIQQQVLPDLPPEPLTAYRDWRIYFPAAPGRQVEMNWKMASYPYIEALDPDLILLERENVELYARPEVVEQAVNPGNMQLTHAFYRDAARNTLTGYRLIFESDYGLVFGRQP